MHGLEGVAGKPMLGRLGLEVLEQQFDLSSAKLLGERYEHIRMPKIAIILEDLIFENQMIPERVPGQV